MAYGRKTVVARAQDGPVQKTDARAKVYASIETFVNPTEEAIGIHQGQPASAKACVNHSWLVATAPDAKL